jgi:amino acid transporter
MSAVTVIYCLVQLAVVGVLPHAAQSPAAIASALEQLLGGARSTTASVAVIVSVYGWLTGFALMTPRILFSMAERHELPAAFGRVHPSFRTPHVAIVVNSSVALALGLSSSFTNAAVLSTISRLVIFATTCAALIVLRKRSNTTAGFRLPAGPAVAILGMGLSGWLLTTRTLADAWTLGAIMAVGVLVWIGAQQTRKLAA